MNDVIDLNKSIKNIEKKRRELIIRNSICKKDPDLLPKKSEKSLIRLKRDNTSNVMLKHLMSDKQYRSKILEDVFNKNFKDQKVMMLKKNISMPMNLKKRMPSFPKKPLENKDTRKNSGYIQLKDKLNTEYSSNNRKSLSRNNNSVSISTTNISKNNISLNKSQGEKKLDTSNLQANLPTKFRDYTSTILEYKTSMNQIRRLTMSMGK
jgi:hypothetical protein